MRNVLITVALLFSVVSFAWGTQSIQSIESAQPTHSKAQQTASKKAGTSQSGKEIIPPIVVAKSPAVTREQAIAQAIAQNSEQAVPEDMSPGTRLPAQAESNTSASKSATVASPGKLASVFTELQAIANQPKPKKPLGGSFADGEKMLRAADPENEANIVFNENGADKGFQLITICGFACLAPGATSEQSAKAAATVAIPATSDTLNEQNKGYNEIAQDFAARFNKQMISRKFPTPKQPDHIAKILPDADLTMNGVTVGKSNLYNSIGRFGTNAFHHEGDAGESIYVVCWKGADRTTVAYESGELGGKDQTILEGRVIASGTEYRFDKYCKPSKKVDSKASLFGIHLGDSVADVEKKKGPATVHVDQRLVYRYQAERKHAKKTADVASEVEIATKDDKVTQVSVGKTETY